MHLVIGRGLIDAPELGAMGIRVKVTETVFDLINCLLYAVILRDLVELTSESVFLEYCCFG